MEIIDKFFAKIPMAGTTVARRVEFEGPDEGKAIIEVIEEVDAEPGAIPTRFVRAMKIFDRSDEGGIRGEDHLLTVHHSEVVRP